MTGLNEVAILGKVDLVSLLQVVGVGHDKSVGGHILDGDGILRGSAKHAHFINRLSIRY